MWAICSIILCIVVSLCEGKRVRFWLNPLTIFCMMWAVILLFSYLRFYGLYEVNSEIYGMIFIGLLFYIVGYYCYDLHLSKYVITIGNKKSNAEKVTELRYKFVYALLLLCCVYYMIYLFEVVNSVGSYSLWAVQQFLRHTEESVISSRVLRLLGSFVIGPVSFAIPAIAATDFWVGRKDKILLIMSCLMLVMKMLSTANRMSLMIFAVLFVLNGILRLRENKKMQELFQRVNKKNIKNAIRVTICIGVIAFIIMSLSRKLNIMQSLYLDFAIPPIMFQTWAETVETGDYVGYGMASLNGFLFPILYFFQHLFGMSGLPEGFQKIYDLIALTDSHWVTVGDSVRANAYVSIFWFLYTDGRLLGIIIGMFLFGIYTANAFFKLRKYPNSKNMSMYCLCILAVFYSLCRMEFALTNYVLAFMFTLLVAYRKENR